MADNYISSCILEYFSRKFQALEGLDLILTEQPNVSKVKRDEWWSLVENLFVPLEEYSVEINLIPAEDPRLIEQCAKLVMISTKRIHIKRMAISCRKTTLDSHSQFVYLEKRYHTYHLDKHLGFEKLADLNADALLSYFNDFLPSRLDKYLNDHSKFNWVFLIKLIHAINQLKPSNTDFHRLFVCDSPPKIWNYNIYLNVPDIRLKDSCIHQDSVPYLSKLMPNLDHLIVDRGCMIMKHSHNLELFFSLNRCT